MLKSVNKPALLAWLQAQAEDAHENMMEDISSYVDGEWTIVNDRTDLQALPLLMNDESRVTQLLAKQCMADKSIYDTDIQGRLEELLLEQLDSSSEKLNLNFPQGRLYQIACLYEELGEEALAIQWKSWAWFNPYE